MEYSATEQTISWFKNRNLQGTLEIRPPYQRKPVWTSKQKCSLIESILLAYPVPEIYVHVETTADGDEKYSIVDGQQRIRTILQFVGAETDLTEEEHNKFVLDKLAADSRYFGKKFEDLDKVEREKFYGYKFAVRNLKTNTESEVREMFSRLNRFLTPLKPQEIRNSTYTGPFAKIANDLADEDFWAAHRIIKPASIRRMGDIEFVSELLISTIHGPQGGSAATIDQYYVQYDDYEDDFPDQKRTVKLFRDTLTLLHPVLNELGPESRWINKTDFYSIFSSTVALVRETRSRSIVNQGLIKSLKDFEMQISARLADESAEVSRSAIDYVRNVEKGANDKARRASRHEILREIMLPFFAQPV